MSKIRKKFLEINPSLILLLLATLFGGYARLQNAITLTFPLNDGGMFFTMTKDLIENGFRLPFITTYNHLNIPFAYPPLQFYIAGGLAVLFNWDLLDIFRFMPALFALLNIPAFYLLTKELTKNELQAGLASVIFALIPSTYDWLIMGGGITRSPAFFFALLCLISIYRLYNRNEKKYIFITAILAALTVLSHPETALHTAASALVFFLFFGRNKQCLIKSILVAALTLLLTSPWWISVLLQHGISPFLAAGQTGFHGLTSILKLFVTNLISEYGLTSISILALIGIVFFIAQKRFFLPVWFLAIYFSEPRSAPLYMTPLMAIFAAYTLVKIMGMINSFEQKSSSETDINLLLSGIGTKVLFAILFGQWIFSALATSNLIGKSYYLTQPNRNAQEWVSENTPINSRFIILTGIHSLTDPVSEWFPTLTKRVSINTSQGYEWVKGTDFELLLENTWELQGCLTQSIECIQIWSRENDKPYDYVYLSNAETYDEDERVLYKSALAELLLQSDEFNAVYNSEGVIIFQYIHK